MPLDSDNIVLDADAVLAGSAPCQARIPAPGDVEKRYDVFAKHREPISRHIVGMTFAGFGQGLTYDWYRARHGMTVELTTQTSLHRASTRPITIRIRHEDANAEVSTLKLGRTVTFDYADDCLLHQEVQEQIMDAVAHGESPLWRLRCHVSLPPFIVEVLDAPIEQGELVGHLDIELAVLALADDMMSEDELFRRLRVERSIYGRRPQ